MQDPAAGRAGGGRGPAARHERHVLGLPLRGHYARLVSSGRPYLAIVSREKPHPDATSGAALPVDRSRRERFGLVRSARRWFHPIVPRKSNPGVIDGGHTSWAPVKTPKIAPPSPGNSADCDREALPWVRIYIHSVRRWNVSYDVIGKMGRVTADITPGHLGEVLIEVRQGTERSWRPPRIPKQRSRSTPRFSWSAAWGDGPLRWHRPIQ